MLETRRGGEPYPLDQYVWDIRYVDAPVVRFHDADTDGISYLDAEDNILYYTTDANWNVTALVDAATGGVVERYMYDAYGKATVLEEDWTPREVNASAVANDVLYAGYRFDSETGLYSTERRIYHPTLGRWLQRDPAGYVDGMSLYEYVSSNPAGLTDPMGLCPGAGTTAPAPDSSWSTADFLKDPGLFPVEGDLAPDWLFETSFTAGSQADGAIVTDENSPERLALRVQQWTGEFEGRPPDQSGQTVSPGTDGCNKFGDPVPSQESTQSVREKINEWFESADRAMGEYLGGIVEGIGAFCLDVAGMIGNGVKDIKTTVLGIWCGLMERITTGGYDPRGGGDNDAAANRLADIQQNPGNWSVESLHAEAATSRLARGGVSEQIIYRNSQTGESVVRHRLTNSSGKVLEDHFRPMYKPRVGEVQ